MRRMIFSLLLLSATGCRLFLPAFLPAGYVPCTIMGDCYIDGGWMRPDGSYIVLPDCKNLPDGGALYGPLAIDGIDAGVGSFVYCPGNVNCPFDCIGSGESYDAGVSITITPDE